MEELKKYKIPLLIILPLAIVMIIYNYVLKKPASADDPYMQQTQSSAPAQNAQPRTQTGSTANPGQQNRPVNNTRRDGNFSRDKFDKYDEIAQEIYSDYEAEEIIYNDINNFFSDFKLSNDMQKKAKSILFTIENRLPSIDKRKSSNPSVNESLILAKDYLSTARAAFNDKNFLKAEIFARKTNVELEKIEAAIKNEESDDGIIINTEKGPTVTILYKGFAVVGNRKIAYVRRTESYSELGIGDTSIFLKLSEGDEITLSDGEKYIIMSITDSELGLRSTRQEDIIRNIPLDKGM